MRHIPLSSRPALFEFTKGPPMRKYIFLSQKRDPSADFYRSVNLQNKKIYMLLLYANIVF